MEDTIQVVFESAGEGFYLHNGVLLGSPDAVDRVRARAGLVQATPSPVSFVDRSGQLHMAFDEALALAKALCAKEPATVLLVELAAEAVRQAVTGNPRATKIDVAEALVAGDFGQLAALVPQRPARAALGLRPRDKYWLHMFDALGLAVSARALSVISPRS